MIRASIIGCGTIADAHAHEIVKNKNAKLISVCDSEPLMAQQMTDRFGASHWYTDAGEMLDKSQPDVVHITTPPQSHFV